MYLIVLSRLILRILMSNFFRRVAVVKPEFSELLSQFAARIEKLSHELLLLIILS
jgi:hypothetical protein